MARSTHFLAAVTIAFASTSGMLRTFAAEDAVPDRQTAGFPVALIDVGRVFKGHAGFGEKMLQLKKELTETEARIQLENEQIKVLQEQLKTLQAQSEEYLKLEDDITARTSSRQVQMAREKRRFMQKEGGIYAETYEEIQQAVGEYARAHGIRLVFRFNSEPINAADSNSVMKGVNRNLVFQDGLDISDEILKRLDGSDNP